MNQPPGGQLHAVVWDPMGPGGIPQGTLLAGDANDFAAALRRGVATLPVHRELLRETAAGLMHVQSFGLGAVYEQNRGEYGCPLLLLARPVAPYIHWVARIAAPREQLSGSLRLVVNPDQPASLRGNVMPIGKGAVDLSTLGLDAFGGYTVGGVARLAAGEGYVGLCLYAIATGCRVLWAAASLSDRP